MAPRVWALTPPAAPAIFMPAKAIMGPVEVFLAAASMALAVASTIRPAAALPPPRKTDCCISFSRFSSSGVALTEDTPKETISRPRRFRHWADSTSLRALAISMVCRGSSV